MRHTDKFSLICKDKKSWVKDLQECNAMMSRVADDDACPGVRLVPAPSSCGAVQCCGGLGCCGCSNAEHIQHGGFLYLVQSFMPVHVWFVHKYGE